MKKLTLKAAVTFTALGIFVSNTAWAADAQSKSGLPTVNIGEDSDPASLEVKAGDSVRTARSNGAVSVGYVHQDGSNGVGARASYERYQWVRFGMNGHEVLKPYEDKQEEAGADGKSKVTRVLKAGLVLSPTFEASGSAGGDRASGYSIRAPYLAGGRVVLVEDWGALEGNATVGAASESIPVGETNRIKSPFHATINLDGKITLPVSVNDVPLYLQGRLFALSNNGFEAKAIVDLGNVKPYAYVRGEKHLDSRGVSGWTYGIGGTVTKVGSFDLPPVAVESSYQTLHLENADNASDDSKRVGVSAGVAW